MRAKWMLLLVSKLSEKEQIANVWGFADYVDPVATPYLSHYSMKAGIDDVKGSEHDWVPVKLYLLQPVIENPMEDLHNISECLLFTTDVAMRKTKSLPLWNF